MERRCYVPAMHATCFREHIGPTIEAYIDDIVVKTKRVSNLVNDLDVAFNCLKAKTLSSTLRSASSTSLEACS
jgi:hypothetical protein